MTMWPAIFVGKTPAGQTSCSAYASSTVWPPAWRFPPASYGKSVLGPPAALMDELHDTTPNSTRGTAPRQSLRAGRAPARPRPLGSGPRRGADLSAALAGEGPHGGAGAHGHPRAGRHGLRRSRRPAGHLRPVRHHRPLDRVCHLRAEPHPGVGAGLVAGRHHRRDDRAAGRRRRRSPGGAGRYARPAHRRPVHSRRAGALRLHHGSALQARSAWAI